MSTVKDSLLRNDGRSSDVAVDVAAAGTVPAPARGGVRASATTHTSSTHVSGIRDTSVTVGCNTMPLASLEYAIRSLNSTSHQPKQSSQVLPVSNCSRGYIIWLSDVLGALLLFCDLFSPHYRAVGDEAKIGTAIWVVAVFVHLAILLPSARRLWSLSLSTHFFFEMEPDGIRANRFIEVSLVNVNTLTHLSISARETLVGQIRATGKAKVDIMFHTARWMKRHWNWPKCLLYVTIITHIATLIINLWFRVTYGWDKNEV